MNNWNDLTEATIDSIRLEVADRVIRIDVTSRWQEERRQQIIAKGVDDFVLNEMRLSNIIDRVIKIEAPHDNDREAAQRLFFMMRGREAEAHELEWPELLNKLARVREGRLTLIEIEPVYGASILILAESLLLKPIGLP